jgi:hypothetical protein
VKRRGKGVVDDRDRLATQLMLYGSPRVKKVAEQLELAIPRFFERYEEITAEDFAKPQDERRGVPNNMQLAYKEILEARVAEVADQMAKDLQTW